MAKSFHDLHRSCGSLAEPAECIGLRTREVGQMLRRQGDRQLRGSPRAKAAVHELGNGSRAGLGLHRRQTGRGTGKGAEAGHGRPPCTRHRCSSPREALGVRDGASRLSTAVRGAERADSADAPNGAIWPEAAPGLSRRTAPSAVPRHRRCKHSPSRGCRSPIPPAPAPGGTLRST